MQCWVCSNLILDSLVLKISSDVLSATLEIIQKTVAKGKKVTLVGFGTWEARKRAARIGRNPQTGKELKIAAKTVPAWSAGKSFKELVKCVERRAFSHSNYHKSSIYSKLVEKCIGDLSWTKKNW